MHKNAEPIIKNKNFLYILSKCGRPKNPCKICFQTVTKRNGLQCRGACKKWAHFNCLGYTPGKIHDIKAGLITIVCPCPDCSTEPKEILVNPPINCHESYCPANNFPKCESKECPKNKCDASFSPSFPCECVNPSVPSMNHSCMKPVTCPPQKVVTCPTQKPVPCPPQKTCKEMSAQKSKSCSCSLAGSHMECKRTSCQPVNCKPVKPTKAPQPCSESSSSDSQLCNKEHEVSGSMINALEQMCQTVTHLSEQIKLIICKLATK